MNTGRRTRTGTAGRAWALLLALALLLPVAQLGAYVHGLSHVAAGDVGDPSPPPGEPCGACVGYAALGGALGADPPAPAFDSPAHAAPASPPAVAVVAIRPNSYRARAPPPARV